MMSRKMHNLQKLISNSKTTAKTALLLQVALLCLQQRSAQAWGNSDGTSDADTGLYGNMMLRDWLYNSNAISLELQGCVWGYVADNEDAGCLEDSSEDGTTYWYQMANCRRAQAVYSLYASSSGSSASCSAGNFKESFVTTNGLNEFIGYLSQYDANNPFGDYVYGDDGYDDDGGGNYQDFDNMPDCEQSDYGYIGLGCAEDGTFALQYFEDSYCLSPTGDTYDKLKSLNRALRTYKGCAGISYGNDGNNGYTLPEYLIASSESCSSLDSGFCIDTEAMESRRSHTSKTSLSTKRAAIGQKSWVTKLKYATGGLLLLASFVMFTGILFTNRRRRRALMQRKYRQSRTDRSRKSRSSKSRTRKSSRSKSRRKEKEGDYY